MLLQCKNVREYFRFEAEVPAQYQSPRVCQEIKERERDIFAKVAIVEDQEEFTTAFSEPLDRVQVAGGEIPGISF